MISLPDFAAQLPRQLRQTLREVRHDVLQVVDPVGQAVQVIVHLAPAKAAKPINIISVVLEVDKYDLKD